MDQGFCETLEDVGGKVNAAVGGSGIPFALIGLFCID